MEEKEPKRKFALWVKESSLDLVEQYYKKDNCSSRSEYIEKAILFYTGYLSSNQNSSYLPNILVSTLKGIVAESDNKINRMLFKLTVELAIAMNVVAASSQINPEDLHKLRKECINEVKRSNGSFQFEDAMEWQKGDPWQG